MSSPVGSTRSMEPLFLALPLRMLADAALGAATAAGASFADFRMERLVTGSLSVRDTAVESAAEATTVGYAVRVVVEGTWGFASAVEPTPDAAAATARRAVEVARSLSSVVAERVERADEPVHRDATWISDYDIDPFEVPATTRIGLLLDRSERLLAADGVAHTTASILQIKENKFYADTAGTTTTQQRIRMEPRLTATAVDPAAGSFDTMDSIAPPVGRGWEYMTGDVWDWDDEITRIPEYLAEKIKAPSVRAGQYDLVIHPSNLWLTIHESIGHATEYD